MSNSHYRRMDSQLMTSPIFHRHLNIQNQSMESSNYICMKKANKGWMNLSKRLMKQLHNQNHQQRFKILQMDRLQLWIHQRKIRLIFNGIRNNRLKNVAAFDIIALYSSLLTNHPYSTAKLLAINLLKIFTLFTPLQYSSIHPEMVRYCSSLIFFS